MLEFYGCSSDWNDTQNWSDGIIPGASDDIRILDPANFTVANLQINATESVAVRSIWMNSPNFTLTVNGNLTVEELYFDNGTVNGSGDVDVLTTLYWYGGTMEGTGITRNFGDAVIYAIPTAPGNPVLDGSRTFVNLADADFNCAFNVAATASVINQGTLTIRQTTMTYSPTTPIVNNGTLVFEDVTVTFTGTNTIANAVELHGGEYLVEGTLTISSLLQNHGPMGFWSRIGGAGSLVVTNQLFWHSGVQQGTGSTIIAPTGKLMLSDGGLSIIRGRTFTVLGTRVPYSQPGTLGDPITYSSQKGENDIATEIFIHTNVQRPPVPPPTTPAGSLTDEGAMLLAGEIYNAMFGGMFGAGVDAERVYRALEGRSLTDVNKIKAAYAVRFKHPNNSPRDMVVDLNSQWGISFSTYATQKLTQLLAGNGAGAIAVDIRKALADSVQHTFLDALRFLRKSDVTAVAAQYAALYPATDPLSFSFITTPTVAAFPDRICFDIEVSYRAIKYAHPASIEMDDYRQSFSSLLAGNLIASDAELIHGLRAGYFERGHLWNAPNDAAVLAVLEGRSPTYIAAVAADYLTRYGTPLADHLQAMLNASGQDALNALLTGNRFDVMAARLRAAFDQDQDGSTTDYDGTDEDAVWNILDGLYIDERCMLAQHYFARYQQTITGEIFSEFSNNAFDGPEQQKTYNLWFKGGLSTAERIYYATEGWGTDEPAVRRAMAELRRMTPAEIAAVQAEYGRLVPQVEDRDANEMFLGWRNQTLEDAFFGDLSGGFRNDAMAALDGQITTVQQYYQLAQRRYNYERGDNAANWLGNLMSGVNTQGQNLDNTWAQIQAAYALITNPNANISTEPAFRQLTARLEQDTEFYRGFRSAAANLAANGVATVAGMAAFALTGGTIAPIIVALAAGASGQTVTRSLVEGYFTWEELPADCLVGAVNGLIAGLTLPSAAAILPAGTRLGVLRATAANPFAGGAVMTGLTTALESDTWSQGFAVGMFNLAAASTTAGLGAWMLTRLPGATVSLASATGATPASLTRTIATGTGRLVVNIVDSEFLASVRTLASAVNGTVRDAIREAITPATIDAITNSLIATANQSISAIRSGIQAAANGLSGPRLAFAEASAVGLVENWLPEFGAFTFANVRDRLLTSMQSAYMTIRDVVDGMTGRLTAAAVATADETLPERLVARLATVPETTDNAVILSWINTIIAQELPDQIGNALLIAQMRSLLVVRALPGANSALRTLGEQFANRARALFSLLDSELEKPHATVAVSRIWENNAWVEVVTLNGSDRLPAAAAATIRAAVEASGGIFRQAPSAGPAGHAERFLYRFLTERGSQIEAIGISHYRGPCPACQPFFEGVNFRNAFWDSTWG